MTDLPSYKLVQRFMHETGFPVADPNDEMVFPDAKFMKLASRLIQYGADQELEACCEWLAKYRKPILGEDLKYVRRPKPPSLKEQALKGLKEVGDFTLGQLEGCSDFNEFKTHVDNIHRALGALPND